MTTTTDVPNHHADFPPFAGPAAAAIGLVMAIRGRGAARLVADLAAVAPGDTVVDIGCGPGTAAREAARRGAQVTGIDPAPVMLRLARLLTRRHRDALDWAAGAAEALPVAATSATVVWSLACVHHWADLDAGLAETHRVLAPGGRLLAIERHSVPGAGGLASHGWTEAQAARFAEQCRSAGFTGVEVQPRRAGRRDLLVVRATRA